jgi:hypothetical protein
MGKPLRFCLHRESSIEHRKFESFSTKIDGNPKQKSNFPKNFLLLYSQLLSKIHSRKNHLIFESNAQVAPIIEGLAPLECLLLKWDFPAAPSRKGQIMKPELKIRTNDYSPAINNQLIYVPVRHSTPVENIRQITPIVQNKPKVKSPQIHSSDVITSTYDQMDNWLNQTNKPNQTQFKPNCKNGRKSLSQKSICNNSRPRAAKNKPKTNPITKSSKNERKYL